MEKKYFFCYSYKLMKFLALLGERYEYVGKHPNGNKFWAYPSTEVLNQRLGQWDAFKKLVSG